MIEATICQEVMEALQSKQTIVVAICGAADLGKSFLSKRLSKQLTSKNVSCSYLPLDAFLMNRSERQQKGISGYSVESHDIMTISSNVKNWKNYQEISFHPYDHTKEYSEEIYAAEFSLYKKNIEPFKERADYTLFLKKKWVYKLQKTKPTRGLYS